MTLEKGVPLSADRVRNLPSPSFTNSTSESRLFFGGGVPAVTHLLFTMTVIRLIGVPAPSDGGSQAPTSPFTTRQRPIVSSYASPSNQVFPGKETIIVTRGRPGLVSDAPRARSPRPLFSKRACPPPSGWSFLDTPKRTVTVHRLTATPKPRASTKRCAKSSCLN